MIEANETTSEYELYKKQYNELRSKEQKSHQQTAAELKLVSEQLVVWKDKAETAERLLAEKNETANTFMRQVQNLQAQLHEANAIIEDMVKNLDAADYDRARKFLSNTSAIPARVPINFTFCARCGEQMKPNDASAEASNRLAC